MRSSHLGLTRLTRLAPALALAGLLSGCTGPGLSRTFGFSRSSPDEFTVTTQPPLSMPPDYAIRAPQAGAPRPQTVSASAEAQAALVASPTAAAAPAAGSAGQQALVQAASRSAGITGGPQIAVAPQSDVSFAHRLLFGGPDTGATPMVNAAAEAARLRHNAALGQSPTAGPTPTIRPASGGWFSHLF